MPPHGSEERMSVIEVQRVSVRALGWVSSVVSEDGDGVMDRGVLLGFVRRSPWLGRVDMGIRDV